MGFDEGSTLPIVDLHKKTTKVNAGMIAAVVIFFLATAIVVILFARHPEETVNKIHSEQQAAP